MVILFLSFFKFSKIFFFLFLLSVFVAVRAFSSCGVVCRLLIVVASRSAEAWTLGCMCASRVATWGLSSCGVWACCSAACGFFLDQGLNPCACIGR